jgi:hypothetical protein
MRPTAPVTFRMLRGGARGGRARAGTRRLFWVGIGLGIVAAIAIVMTTLTAGRRAVHAIPDGQRMAIYSRTLDDLKKLCGDRPPEALQDHCRELASFISQFDECRDECEAIVHAQLAPNPTR